ncbi:unnamed protein product [Nezara viridula]|uniref:Uncharacterized protein n=1 Tax=Nezara viridula TaxID=85310 RepID=A0A9P0HEV7_NEZVI|nr:unnamed protein product [Nezara viridula]
MCVASRKFPIGVVGSVPNICGLLKAYFILCIGDVPAQ